MTKNQPKDHHFVPQALTRFFRFNKTQVFYFEKDVGKIEPRNPRSIFHGRYLFSRIDENGQKYPEVEQRFGREIDNEINRFVSRRVFSESLDGRLPASEAERLFFQSLLLNLFIRPPETHGYLFRSLSGRFALAIHDLSEIVRLGRLKAAQRKIAARSEFTQEILGSAHIDNVHFLSKHGMYFLYPNEGSREFILGSFPVLRNVLTRQDRKSHFCGPTKNKIEYFMPLAPRLGLLFSGEVSLNFNVSIDDDRVARLNSEIYRCSYAIAARSDELIKETIDFCR